MSNETIMLSMEEFQRLSNLASSVNELSQRLVTPERTTSQTSSRLEPRIADPCFFDGKRHLLKNFVSQLRLVIYGQPSRYTTERSKVIFAASFLREAAFSWFQPILNSDPSHVLENFDLFIQLLEETFGDPDETANAERHLASLTQTNSAINYASEFRRIAAMTEWNDPAKCHHFYNGLKSSVKDELAKVKRPSSLADLIELAISIDNRLFDRSRERNIQCNSRFPPQKNFDLKQPSHAPPLLKNDPMVIDATYSQKRKSLSLPEKQRRIDNKLCLYCGEPGHYVDNCPQVPKKPGRVKASLKGRISPPLETTQLDDEVLPKDHLAIPCVLSFANTQISSEILLDTGATSNFIDQNYCIQNEIPLVTKESPSKIETIDGRPLASGLVIQETLPILVSIGSHIEKVTFDVISLKHYPIILGMPWFRLHNPQILWSKEEVSFPHCDCEHTNRPNFICATLPPSIPIPEFIDEIDSENIASIVPREHHQYLSIFSAQEANSLPNHSAYDHSIPLVENGVPPFGPIYSLSQTELEALSEYIKENLAKGFIRPSSSPAGAPILFVKKKDSSLRMCVDYRGLNNITVKNRYPLPLIHEMLDRLVGSKYFTKLDLRGAYNLVRIKEGEEWKTAFRTRYGHFEFTVMPFGLTNAPATFQALMNDTLREFLDIFAIVYLDDILIFSTTLESHISHVNQILERLAARKLYVNSEKSSFHQSSVNFLGYEISSTGLAMDSTKVSAVLSWPLPCSVKDVQSFLGFANFYRRFIKDYAKIAQPLTNLLRKDTPFKIDTNVEAAFSHLKTLFTSAPLLRHFDPNLTITLETDASDYAIGAVLSQSDDTETFPVAFYSRKLTPAEQNYPIYDKEMLAIVAAVMEWRNYLEGSLHTFTILTDHKNLEYFMTAKTLNRRQARWSELLSGYKYNLKYTPGSQNGKADALSRRQDFKNSLEEDKCSYNTRIVIPKTQLLLANCEPHEAVTLEQNAMSIKDAVLECLPGDITFKKITSSLTKDSPFQLHENLLYFKGSLYIPDNAALRLRILNEFHDCKLAGHFGKRKTYKHVRRYYY